MHSLLLVVIELIIADLVLGGDNAIVIALATKNLEPSIKKKASFIGAMLAIILRVIFVFIIIVVGEQHIPFLNIVAGGFLVYIAIQLISFGDEEHEIKSQDTIGKAIKTIVISDAIMSLDNAIVIATIATSASLGLELEMALVVLALLFSFPIILFGASILSKIIEKYKFVVYIFSLIIVHSAIEMILKDKIIQDLSNFVSPHLIEALDKSITIFIISFIIIMLKVVFDKKQGKDN